MMKCSSHPRFRGSSSPKSLSFSNCKGAWSHNYSRSEQGLIHTHRVAGHVLNVYGMQIDLPHAEPERIAAQMCSIFGLQEADVIHVSAKTGFGVDRVLRAIIERIPPPTGEAAESLKALLFDSSYVIPCFRVQCSPTQILKDTIAIEV